MIRIITALLLVSICFSALAQINVDSLWNVWNDQSLSDSSRLKAIDELTFKHYLLVDLDSSLILANLMLEFAANKKLKKYEADALHNMGVIEGTKGNTTESLAFDHRSLAIRKEIGDKKGMGRSLANIGSKLQSLGEIANALKHYNEALIYFEEIGDNDLVAHALLNTASIHAQTDDFPAAINYLSRSVKALEGTENGYFLSNALMMLSSMYFKNKDLELAKKYAEQLRSVAHKYNYRGGESSALSLLGTIHRDAGNYDLAMEFYEEALLLNEKADNIFVTIDSYSSMANVFKLKGDHDQALAMFEKALRLARSVDKKVSVANNTIDIGLIYLIKKGFRNAIKWCGEGLTLANDLNNLDSQLKACECLYEAHKSLKNGNEALKYHELLLEYTNRLKKEETIKKLQNMEFQKQVLADSIAAAEATRLVKEAHEEEIKQNNRTRNILAGAGLFALLLAGGFYSRWRYVRKSRAIIEKEKDRSNNLLLNILPEDIAEELKIYGKAEARDFDMVSILFTDFKGFTQTSEKLSAQELVAEINTCFEAFDGIMSRYKIEKIKTIGDAYMAAGGLPIPADDSVKNTVFAAMEMQAFIKKRKAENESAGKPAFEMRVGIHTGPVVAGIVGVKKFQYDIWGDTVNTASRMESSGEVGQVNISQITYDLLKDDQDFSFDYRGRIKAKGKGEMKMYFVSKK